MKKRILIAAVTLSVLASVVVMDSFFDSRLSSAVDMDYVLRVIQTREESEKIPSSIIEPWYIYEDRAVESSFPKDMMTELAEAFLNDEVQEFVDSYEAEYKTLTQKEIGAYVDLDPVMHKFHETEEAEMKVSVWYQLRVNADKVTSDDLVVQGESESYVFLSSWGIMEKGLPIVGGEVFFVEWGGNNFIISPLKSYLGEERLGVYFFNGATYGREAVLTKAEEGGVEISYYYYAVW